MKNEPDATADQSLDAEETRVTSLELFFDLVFVFTLTQLTSLLARSLSWESLLQAFLIFIVLFWMYGGYVWLTNSISPVTASRQLLLIAGMAAFLICALAIPHAFQTTGLIFGIGYLLVIAVHGAMYVRAVGLEVARFVPMNFLSAAAIIAASFADGYAKYLFWLLAIALHVVTSFLGTGVRFEIHVSHFTERHGLLLLVALGESIVAIGVGGIVLDIRLILAAVLGLLLSAALWWLYFAHDEDAARATMLTRPNTAQLRQALEGYFYAFIPMLFGIILLATGIKSSIEHLTVRLDLAHAFALGGGVALYLIGTIIFRRAADIPGVTYRYIAACLVLLTAFIGNQLYAALQLASLILVLIVLVLFEAKGAFLKPRV